MEQGADLYSTEIEMACTMAADYVRALHETVDEMIIREDEAVELVLTISRWPGKLVYAVMKYSIHKLCMRFIDVSDQLSYDYRINNESEDELEFIITYIPKRNLDLYYRTHKR